ncbi:unnamed protein product [Rotaria socialis]|uniref:Uncharacterized protein n=1 Tax=Rotaria socialis TaxID=392032 RepID=A0A821F2T1_9BILA|nr:unnamed protein product [Rotaria socialis]
MGNFGVCFCLCIILIPFIIWGSVSTAAYVRYRNIHKSHTNTTCLLLNYTVHQHECENCDSESCTYYTCYDERFLVKYPISNGTFITGTSASFDRDEPHKQTQIGKSYTCFYNLIDVTSAIMELPNEKTKLIQLCIAFGLVGLPVLVIFSCLVYLLSSKINRNCSCFSILKKWIQSIGARMQATKKIEQSADDINLNQIARF